MRYVFGVLAALLVIVAPPAGAPSTAPSTTSAEVRAEVAASRQTIALTPLPRLTPCGGDGTSGNRVAAYYVYASGTANRLAAYRTALVSYLEQANSITYLSARALGGKRYLRLVTDRACRPVVTALKVPASALRTFGDTITYVQQHGLARTDRKYVMFADTNSICGLGTLAIDAQPGAANVNNVGPSWARIDRGCWTGATAAHEIFHMLGAVQPGAPHYDGTGHCTDEYDVMCYDAGGKHPVVRCAPRRLDIILDCHGDDYFNLRPKPGSWLAAHWNTANSSFLYGGGPTRAAGSAKAKAAAAGRK